MNEVQSGVVKGELSKNGGSGGMSGLTPPKNHQPGTEAEVDTEGHDSVTQMNGGHDQNGTASASMDKAAVSVSMSEQKSWFRKRQPVDILPPEIPHISNNIIPLSNVLKFSSQEAYKQLTSMIERLAETSENGEDINRKREFLHLIVGLREDFVKIYTLVKWAVNAKDIGKLIDLLNWFRQQEFYFESLSMGLNELNQYLGAKLPNSDLVTSLEVLIKGRPQLPSYNFLKLSSISPEKTLEVLEDLNLILTTRMAFISDIPKVYLRNFEIKDGRIYFTVPQQYQVSVTVANSLIIEDDIKDNHSSPFYFIDFQFLFGINPATGCLDDSRGTVSRMPSNKHLETLANSTLLSLGLTGLHELLHKYAVSFKVYLLSRQVKEMLVGSMKWKDSLQYKFQHGQSIITINYWCQNYNSRNWKSLVELGVDKNNKVTFRWFKDEKYQHDHQLMKLVKLQPTVPTASSCYSDSSSSAASTTDPNEGDSMNDDDYYEINVDLIVTMILNKHAEQLMGKITSMYNDIISGHGLPSEEFCTFILSHQVCLKLSPSKKTTFALNSLTGAFYFIEPTPLQNEFIVKINSPLPQQTHKRTGFLITEHEMCEHIVNQLIQLRLATSNKEINTKLSTTQWIPNQLIKLNEYETNKLYNFLSGSNHSELLHLPSEKPSSTRGLSSLSLLQFYRRKNWPSSWFLVKLIDGVSCRTYWWVSRIKSIKGEWKIQWVQVLMFDEEAYLAEGSSKEVKKVLSPASMGFGLFNSLSTICSNMIIDHMILEELHAKKIEFVKTNKVDSVLRKYGINAPSAQASDKKNIDDDGDVITNESNIIIYNNNKLLRVENSGSSLFLKVTLVSQNNFTVMKLKLFGNLRNLLFKNSPDELKQLSLTIDEQDKYFEICDSINLSQTLSGQSEIGSLASTNSSGADSSSPSVSLNGTSSSGLLDKIFNNLNKLNELIKILGQVNKYAIPIVNNSINEISVKLDEEYVIKIQLPSNRNRLITLAIDGESECKVNVVDDELMKYFTLVISYVNEYLQGRNRMFGSPVDIRGVLMFLSRFLLVFKLTMVIRQAIDKHRDQIKLSNGLSKLSFDLRINNLKQMQLLFFIRYSAGGKKILKDKIVIHLDFRVNKFINIKDKQDPLMLKLSIKDNLNTKNLKHKELFENMFKSLSNVQGVSMLRYDFLLEPQCLSTVFERIAQVFLKHIDK
ncbi:mediator complex subunit [Scheffersomyces spartinae]|uniref:Mediator of RNA polymerase II transcription subunit 14 n=1 Tax=Scheffersomyces spartinae TaxID=45513 RepID=A0A9P8AI91_9ASCO|nr:mediator complex subunit [Scheffersomyces spartinae]KAG7193394.1 mediator complex subunit [Scheffersomyces spartinae]